MNSWNITFYITYRWSKVFSVCRLYSVYNENLVTRKCEEIIWHCSRTRVPPPVCIDLKKRGKERKNDKRNRKEKRFFRYELSSAKRVRPFANSSCFLTHAHFRLLKRTLTNKREEENDSPRLILFRCWYENLRNNNSWNRMYVILIETDRSECETEGMNHRVRCTCNNVKIHYNELSLCCEHI